VSHQIDHSWVSTGFLSKPALGEKLVNLGIFLLLTVLHVARQLMNDKKHEREREEKMYTGLLLKYVWMRWGISRSMT